MEEQKVIRNDDLRAVKAALDEGTIQVPDECLPVLIEAMQNGASLEAAICKATAETTEAIESEATVTTEAENSGRLSVKDIIFVTLFILAIIALAIGVSVYPRWWIYSFAPLTVFLIAAMAADWHLV